MAFANGSEVRRAYVDETTFGVTPATPAFKTARTTGGSLRANKTLVTLEEIQQDRNVRDELLVGHDVTGNWTGEFSAETFDDFIAAALRGAWTTNVLKNGILRPSFTMEETGNFGGVATYRRFRGIMMNTMGLTLPSRAKVAVDFGMMGAQELLDSAIITGATYAAANTNQPATTSANVGALTVGGVTTPFRVTNLSLEVNNGLRARGSVGTLYTAEFGAGPANITGTVECYWEGNDQYQAVLDHGLGTISFTMGVEANKKYTVSIPRARWLDGAPTWGDNNSDAMLSIPFRATWDPVTACSLQVTRLVA